MHWNSEGVSCSKDVCVAKMIAREDLRSNCKKNLRNFCFLASITLSKTRHNAAKWNKVSWQFTVHVWMCSHLNIFICSKQDVRLLNYNDKLMKIERKIASSAREVFQKVMFFWSLNRLITWHATFLNCKSLSVIFLEECVQNWFPRG